MAEERVHRKLAAILAADVVGYSRMMGSNEEGTLARMKKVRADLIDPKIAEYSGRIFKTTGDGILAEFPSAVDAVRHAVDFQRAMTEINVNLPEDEKIAFRIGISLGDVMVDGDDLFGNGVNIASRMEGLAESGGICISGNVYEHVSNTLDVPLEDLGEQAVKNINRPVRCYRVHLEQNNHTGTNRPLRRDKPSIAVLPFQNMSGDPEQEYFVDGVVEDIITALSKIRHFFVIARNTTFSYKGQAVDVASIARELGVLYVLEGSVRKAGNRVRITAQLIDGKTGNHIWAERYDRNLDDIFEVQDEITQTVVGAIEPELSRAERERALRTPPESLTAWDYVHQGWWHLYKFEQSAIGDGENCFHRALEADSSFAPAHVGIARAKFIRVFGGSAEAMDDALAVGVEAAKKAVSLDEKDPTAWAVLGPLYLVKRDHSFAIDALQRALEINPSSADAHRWLGMVYAFAGRSEDAIREADIATRLSPNDPMLWSCMHVRACAYLHSAQFEQSAEWAGRALSQPHVSQNPYVVRLIALTSLDRLDAGKEALESLTKKFPDVTIEKILNRTPFMRNKDSGIWVDGLRRAGVAEGDQLTHNLTR